jgi:site-specific DNA-methyltransferase (adenine-specific)
MRDVVLATSEQAEDAYVDFCERITKCNGQALILNGDSLDILERLLRLSAPPKISTVFADPPYFLSNDGITCKSGKMVSVNKGQWDASQGIESDHEFNKIWLSLCQRVLAINGTMWVSGTHHVIHSVGFAMQQLQMKILNNITWEKPNPPPNLACRYFTHSTETLLWAAKSTKSKHFFDYEAMKAENHGKQMKSVWQFNAPSSSEKLLGKHPTQKPTALLRRILKASTPPGGIVLDPFFGSGTTGVAAAELGFNVIGIEQDESYCQLSRSRVLAVIQSSFDFGM